MTQLLSQDGSFPASLALLFVVSFVVTMVVSP